MYLGKLEISRSPSAQALSSLISPEAEGARIVARHKLLWAAFSDGPDRTRDFLWREERDGVFFTLSSRPPVQIDLFAPIEVKPFAPDLAVGDKLSFALRANATRMKRGGARVDVVMDALHGLAAAERAREAIAQREGAEWLARQGEKAGFVPRTVVVQGYSVQVLAGYRGPRRGQRQFGVLNMVGVLEITNPAAFLAQLTKGFGRAKAFGCGLMMIRRAE
jgi:CRISPR system Cascade subunit CasE